MATMIEIKNIAGSTVVSVPITEECKTYDELQTMCYAQLSWSSDALIELPAGAYIVANGKTYRLLEPYKPDMADEYEYQYKPKFYDSVAEWSKKPFFLISDTGVETDWQLTGYPAQFMALIVKALKAYTGVTYTYSIDSSIAQESMEYISFQNVNIFDALTSIAGAWDTEWWVDGTVIHLSKCSYGTATALTVGDNVGAPSITRSTDGYYTRYYAFGSTRNITQDYNDSGFTNGLVNKRLTLDLSKYAGGYIDTKSGLAQEEIFVKTLIFDDIYPSSTLTISSVTAETKDLLDGDSNKIQIGTDDDGNPVYKKYSVWRFKIDGFTFNNSTYDKDDNPDGMLISGLDLSVSFESGQLNGRDFTLEYLEATQEYRINWVEENSMIIPGTTSLIPADGDEIILYNIKMPDEYVTSAQERLEAALLAEMAKAAKDKNTYAVPSNPVAFNEDGTDMKVGMAVNFVCGGTTLSTRVLKVEKQIDYPIEQTITIGEQVIKGNTAEIKEEVINANQNIDEVKALADLSKAITDGYGRVQRQIQESLAKYQGIWTLNKHGNETDTTQWTIDTDYTAFSAKDFIAAATTDELPSEVLPVAADYTTTGLYKAKSGGGLLYGSEGWYVDPSYAGSGGTAVAWGTSTSDYVSLSVDGTSKNVSLDGHTHSNYLTGLSLSTSGSGGFVTNVSVSGSTITQTKADLTLAQWEAATNTTGNKYIGKSNGDNDIIFRERGNFYQGAIFWEVPTINGVSMDDRYVTLETAQTVTGAKKFTANPLIGTHIGPTDNVHILLGLGAGNCINGVNSSGVVANLYFNYVDGSNYTRVDGSNNVVTTGDVVAMSTGTAVSSLPTATSTNFGLVKIDNSTIKLNSSNQLYCTVSGGSGSGSTVSISGLLTSGTTIGTLTIDGTAYTLKAPTSSGGGTTVSWGTQQTNYVPLNVGGTSKNLSLNGHTHNYSTVSFTGSLSSGTQIGTITINGTSTAIYAPSSSGGSTTFTLASASFGSEIVWSCSSASYGIRVRRTSNSTETRISGNVIDGRTGSSYSIGNLYFNYVSSSVNVRMDSSGKIYSNGSQVTSDLRLKNVEGNEEDVLDRMMQIPVIKFRRNDIENSEQTTGFGAQSFIGVFDNVTFTNEDSGFYGINEGAITAITFQGVKELYSKFQSQQTQITALQEQVETLLQIVKELKGGES